MKPLVTNKGVMTLLCMLPFDEGTSLRKRIACIAFSSFVFLANLAGLIASVAFIVKFNTSDLDRSLYALMHMFPFFAMAYSVFVIFFLRHRMGEVFRKLTEIYDACRNLF